MSRLFYPPGRASQVEFPSQTAQSLIDKAEPKESVGRAAGGAPEL